MKVKSIYGFPSKKKEDSLRFKVGNHKNMIRHYFNIMESKNSSKKISKQSNLRILRAN
jgi:hypothetical protein